MFEQAYVPAIEAGANPVSYWDMTYAEIRALIEAYQNRKQNEMRQQAIIAHAEANLIGISVARLMDNSAKYPSLEDAFPGLFSDMKEEIDKKREEAKLAEWKAKFMSFADHNNRKHRA